MAIIILIILIGVLFGLAYIICGGFHLNIPSISKPYVHKYEPQTKQVAISDEKKEKIDEGYILDIPEWKIRKIVEILNNEKKEYLCSHFMQVYLCIFRVWRTCI